MLRTRWGGRPAPSEADGDGVAIVVARVATGMLSGLLPALRAAPSEALRGL